MKMTFTCLECGSEAFIFKEINLSTEYGKKMRRLSKSRLAFVPILLLSGPTFNLQTDDWSIVWFLLI
jgi:hypothetical protein